jgi:hypothetical protein
MERERKEGGVNGYQELAGEGVDSEGALGVGEEFADPDTPRGDPEQKGLGRRLHPEYPKPPDCHKLEAGGENSLDTEAAAQAEVDLYGAQGFGGSAEEEVIRHFCPYQQ